MARLGRRRRSPRRRRSGKPILLSVGYAACHWCHVMAHESFEDEATAAVMNRLFVNIKVDREERPDVDQIYMAALHALGEQGGWPLTMFLTSDGEPIWGGTYFPKRGPLRPSGLRLGPRGGRPHLRDEPRQGRDTTARHPHGPAHAQRPPAARRRARSRSPRPRRRASARLHRPERGGIRGAPKFPQASLLELLWRAGLRTGDPRLSRGRPPHASQPSPHGGIYDHLGGGFARYSRRRALARAAFREDALRQRPARRADDLRLRATGDPLFRRRIEETIAWLEREMTLARRRLRCEPRRRHRGPGRQVLRLARDEILEVLGADEGAFFADVYDVDAGRQLGGRLDPQPPRPRAARPPRRGAPRRRRARLLDAARTARPPGHRRQGPRRLERADDRRARPRRREPRPTRLDRAGGARLRASSPTRMALDGRLAHRLPRRQVGLPRPRHRLRRHDQGGTGASPSDRRPDLSRRARNAWPPTVHRHHWDADSPAISSPPTTPRPDRAAASAARTRRRRTPTA